MKTSTKSKIRKASKVPAQTYGYVFAGKLRNAADHIQNQDSGEMCRGPECRKTIIPADIYTASRAHRRGVVYGLRDIAQQIVDAPDQKIQIGLCEAPKGLTVEVARDVLYIMRAVGV